MQIGDFERTIEVVPIDLPQEEPQEQPYEPTYEPSEPEPAVKEPAHV